MNRKYLRFLPFTDWEVGKACLLITLVPFHVNSASSWNESSGNRTEVTSGYTSQEIEDYPLFVSGEGSELVVDLPLEFSTSSHTTAAAVVQNQGTLTLNGAILQTHNQVSPGVKVSSGTLNMDSSTINNSAKSSHGVAANGASTLNITNSTITLAGTSSYGIELKDRASLVADGLQFNINSTSTGTGITLSNKDAKAHVSNSIFNVAAGGNNYAIQQNTGQLDANNLTITAKGKAGGLRVGDWGQDRSIKTTLSDSTVDTEGGTALFIRNLVAELNNVNVTTNGNSARALDINSNASVTVNGGSYTTHGSLNADAIWLATDTELHINDAALTTFGNEARALNAQLGSAMAESVKLTTSGISSHAFYAENQSSGNNLIIETTGERSMGIFSVGQKGKVDVTNSAIDTYGTSASGIVAYPQAAVTASNVSVTTHGDGDASALLVRVGNINVDNSILTSEGNAPALIANGYSDTLFNKVQLDNVKLTSAAKEAINATATTLKMQASNSSVLQGGNGQLLNVFTVADTAKSTVLASHVELEATNKTSLYGDVHVDPDSYASVVLRESSQLTGVVNNADVGVYSNSLWQMTGSSSVQNLVNEGTVAFNTGAVNDVLTVEGNYQGNNGTIKFNTVLGDDSSATNKLIVEGDTSGSTHVAVLNAGGTGAKTINGIELVQVNGVSDGEFVQQGRIVAGAYEYKLERGEGANTRNWYIVNWVPDDSSLEPEPQPQPQPQPQPEPQPVPEPQPGPLPTRSAVIRPEAGGYVANSAAAATLFNLSLHDRLGNQSQSNDSGHRTSLWLRQIGGHNRAYIADQLEAQSNRYSVQLGGDLFQQEARTGSLHIGPMFGYGHQSTNIRSKVSGLSSDSSISGYSVGAYASWFANEESETGLWLDSWLQYNWFNSSVSGEGLWTEKYHTQGISASLEAGYGWKAFERTGINQRTYGFYLQPHAQFIFNGLKTVRLVEQNGTQVVANKNSNLISRIGVRGWITESKQPGESNLKPYVELNWLYNSDPYRVDLNQVSVKQNSGRNLAELKTGIEGKINDNFQINGSVALQHGRYHYQDASLMLGAKYTF
jgi:autotransporter family porin